VRGTHALFPEERVRHGERGRDPAVRVYWPSGQPVHDALDRIAYVLRGRHHYGAREQHDGGERDVHPENRTVDGHRLTLDELPEPAQQLQHVADGCEYYTTKTTNGNECNCSYGGGGAPAVVVMARRDGAPRADFRRETTEMTKTNN